MKVERFASASFVPVSIYLVLTNAEKKTAKKMERLGIKCEDVGLLRKYWKHPKPLKWNPNPYFLSIAFKQTDNMLLLF